MVFINEECAICLELLENEVCYLSCSHFFHLDCLTNWINKNNQNKTPIKCPLCNSLFEINTIFYKNTSYNHNICQNTSHNITPNITPNIDHSINHNTDYNTTHNEYRPIVLRKKKRKTKCCSIL